jgi:hypothetical protein
MYATTSKATSVRLKVQIRPVPLFKRLGKVSDSHESGFSPPKGQRFITQDPGENPEISLSRDPG